MGNLILQGDSTEYPGFSLLGETTLIITMDETGASPFAFNRLDFLVLNGTTSVTIASTGAINGGPNELGQLAEKNNVLTTVTINGAEEFRMGSFLTGNANSGDAVVTDIGATAASPTTIHSSLTLINASSMPAGGVEIFAGATNTSGAGNFANGASLNANVTITYTGLTIKGGSVGNEIENDAKKGIVIDGNGDDSVILGGADAKSTLGTGTDRVFVGVSNLGTDESAGSAVGDKVTFGAADTAKLVVGTGAEAGSTINNAVIGLTKVVKAADGMVIDFSTFGITNDSTIVDETAAAGVASATTLKAAENAAIAALGGMGDRGVAYFVFHGNEYFIATDKVETAVSANDAIVELVGITNIHHAANVFGLVTLHV
jgi:hypothetical protein